MPHRRESLPYWIGIVQDGLTNLKGLKAKTALALTGIMIGTVAVIAILNIGHNARLASLKTYEDLGLDLISITPGYSEPRTIIDTATALALPGAAVGVTSSAVYVMGGASAVLGRQTVPLSWIGVSESFYGVLDVDMLEGRTTSDLDGFSPVGVLGCEIAAKITEQTGTPVRVGQAITLDTHIFTVVGLLNCAAGAGILGLDLNNSLIVPLKAAARFSGRNDVNVVGRLTPDMDDRHAADLIKFHFRNLYRAPGQVNVFTAHEMLRNVDQQMKIYTLLLVGIGSISVAVGGVGVMNVMLMNVLERRSETGLRLALGARPVDIRVLFLTESVVLSLAGTVFGAVLGTVTSWVFALWFGWTFEPAPEALPVGIAMALVVGVFFGAYPAIKASRLKPIETLRTG